MPASVVLTQYSSLVDRYIIVLNHSCIFDFHNIPTSHSGTSTEQPEVAIPSLGCFMIFITHYSQTECHHKQPNPQCTVWHVCAITESTQELLTD